MPLLYSGGEALNLIERARILAHAIGNPGCDPLFPETFLYDGRPALPAKFLDAVNLIVDLAAYGNGDFETWPSSSQAEGWTFDALGGSGTLAKTSVAGEFHSGAFAAKITGGTNGAVLSREFSARAGEKRKLDAWLKGNGVNADGITARLVNTATGRWLNSVGAWVGTAADALSQLGGSYAQKTLNYQVESLGRCGGRGVVTLRLEIRAISGVTVFVDDTDDWPAADLLSFHGLICEGKAEPTWTVADDGTSWADAVAAGSATNGFAPDEIP